MLRPMRRTGNSTNSNTSTISADSFKMRGKQQQRPKITAQDPKAAILKTPPITPESKDGESPSRVQQQGPIIQHFYDPVALPTEEDSIITTSTPTPPKATMMRNIRDSYGTGTMGSPTNEETNSTKQQQTHQDPPAQMMRSSSLEANQVLNRNTTIPPEPTPATTNTSVTTAAPHETSLVHSMLQMVDMSCVATGLLPDDEIASPNDDDESVPEWGKPPAVARVVTYDNDTTRRQENFELVYQEPPEKRKSNWLLFKRPKPQDRVMGIAKRQEGSSGDVASKRNMDKSASAAAALSKRSSSPSETKKATTNASGVRPARFLRKVLFQKHNNEKPPDTTKQTVATTARKTTRSPSPTMLLQSIKPSVLETVPEEDLKVSVPGDPHTILCGKDLIGSEIVEEIYAILETSMEEYMDEEEAGKRQAPPNNEKKSTGTPPIVIPKVVESSQSNNMVLSETSQVVYSSTPVKHSGYQKFESDDDEEELFTPPAKSTKAEKVSSSDADESDGISRPRLWKEKLGLSKSTSSDNNDAVPKQNKKPMWKPVVDQATGRTYYYHRKTRETTWNKPNDEDLVVVKKKATKTPVTATQQNALSAQNVEIQRLVGLLPTESASELVKRHSGETLIQKLHDLVETSSKPFDEPVGPSNQKHDEKSIANKTHTAATIMSGFSSHKSRISEMTEQIKNTTSQKKQQKEVPEQPVVAAVGKPPAIPRNIPVPRLRELQVEEFNSTRGERAVPARSFRSIRNPPRLLGTQIDKDTTSKHPTKLNEEDANYMGDAENDYDDEAGGEDDDDRESYAATDSISALSEDNLSYIDRREAYDDVRRRALHRAIAQQDWDMAAQMTAQLKDRPPAKLAMTPKHAVSEIDRLMAENDWVAVSHYIDNAQDRARETERHRINRHLGRSAAPQKRFGARSQLQHSDWVTGLGGDGDSDSLGMSEYTSESTSPKRGGLAAPRARARKPKEFAC